ncbi:MAG: hypothetical protein ACKVS6_01785 [Planctomycetota bacterium]
MNALKTGDYVRHSSCAEWGVGLIADIRGTMAIVLFENSERPREFRMPSTFLKSAPEAAATPPNVSHLKSALRAAGVKRKSSTASKSLRSFDEVVIGFRSTYPEGFASAGWVEIREKHKKMQEQLNTILGAAKWRELVAAGSIEDLAKLHREFVQKAGLMHPVQAVKISSIKDGAFWFAYGEWIWRPEPDTAACEEMIKGYATVAQATWPNISALRGVLYPLTDVFVKPESVKRTATALKQDLPYDSKPTFNGYHRIVEFTKKVRERLTKEGLAPVDLWDVAQFFRLVAGRPVDQLAPAKKTRAKAKKVAAPKDEPTETNV